MRRPVPVPLSELWPLWLSSWPTDASSTPTSCLLPTPSVPEPESSRPAPSIVVPVSLQHGSMMRSSSLACSFLVYLRRLALLSDAEYILAAHRFLFVGLPKVLHRKD